MWTPHCGELLTDLAIAISFRLINYVTHKMRLKVIGLIRESLREILLAIRESVLLPNPYKSRKVTLSKKILF